MKTRVSFVTNSSSACFVVINKTNVKPQGFAKDRDLKIGEIGATEFGWDFTTYWGMYSRINFAWLQVLCANNDEWRDMFKRALEGYAGFNSVAYDSLGDPWDEPKPEFTGYIDHQSAAYEGENTEIFDDYETLLAFLFDDGSYIEGGNDNV